MIQESLAIEARALTKVFGNARALGGLDLEVGVGDMHRFLGPNGTGKPTTLRLVQRAQGVGVQIVHHQHGTVGAGVVKGEQLVDLDGPVEIFRAVGQCG